MADAEDLKILSTRLQDTAGKLKNFSWLPKKRRFAAVRNHLHWEAGGMLLVRTAPHFDGVLKVQSHQVKQGMGEAKTLKRSRRQVPKRALRSRLAAGATMQADIGGTGRP